MESLEEEKLLQFPELNVSVALKIDGAGVITFARMAPGCIFATPDKVKKAEELLVGQKVSEKLF